MATQQTKAWTLQLYVCMYGVPLDLGLKTRTRTFMSPLIRSPLYPLNPDCLTNFWLSGHPHRL